MRGRRPGPRLLAILIALTALCSLAGCSGPNFASLADDLRFGDEEVADTQTVYSMKVPSGGLGKLIRHDQLAWAEGQYAAGASAAGVTVRRLFISTPALQCETLKHTYQEETTEEGPWNWDERNRSCDKTRKLSWLEKTMWTMYEQQSDDTIDWLSTSRNTLVASGGTVSTLQANAVPMYDAWDANAGKYLNIAQAVLVIAAAISLTILGARIVWRIGEASGGGMDGHLLSRVGWIFLGVFMGSSAASIALTFFKRASTTYMGDPAGASQVTNPSLMSWTPGQGTSFFVSDWVRLQVDPFLLIAAVCGVLAAGFKLITTQEGRDLIPLGKAFMWAMLTSVCLAGFVNLFQGTVDTWTAGVLKAASSMMKTAWSHNTLAASEFFNLDGPIALVLTIVMWFCNLISKVFCYLRAGLLPIMVGVAPMWAAMSWTETVRLGIASYRVAPMWAAMSWTETGRQAFGKVMGWLFAFLLYKPVAALVMAAGCSIMVTAGAGDDSQAITLMLTISVIVLLPAMIRLIVPAVAGSVGGGGVIPSMLGGVAGMGVMAAGGALKAGAKAMTGLASGGGRPSAPDGAKPSGGSDPAAPAAVDGAGRGTAGGAESSLAGPDGSAGGPPDGGATDQPSTPSGTPRGGWDPAGASGSDPSVPSASRPSAPAAGDGPDGANRTSTRKTKEF
ncbi:hypothetical protein AB4915_10060 [Bifidobacterium dentium]|uniref:hypothetical protein n=1 Tax=Bifidobacterium dentium TaxID=1689 RepID=UPI003D17593C